MERNIMQEYSDKNCAQCGEKFTETDDIAVCPDCGTPIHRKCWNGHCPNEDKHAAGYDWRKDNADAQKHVGTNGEKICSICKNPITDRPVYCPDCGEPMHIGCYMKNGGCPNTDQHDGVYFDHDDFARDDGFGEQKIFINSYDSFADKVMKNPVKDRITGEPLTCHGVTQAELLHFLGKNYLSTPRYMGIFLRMAMTGKKSAFNLWAGLLMPFYQFYQKMIGPGLILLLIDFILSLPQLAVQTSILAETALSAAPEAFVDAQYAGIINVLSFVSLGIQILLAFFGDYLYMRWTVGKILALREKCKDVSETEYYEILERKGNPKWYFTLLGLGLSLLITYIFTVFILG